MTLKPVSYTHLDVYKRQVQDIAEVIESWTKIPVKKITEAETQKLLNLEANLHKRIIGQNEACLLYTSRCV